MPQIPVALTVAYLSTQTGEIVSNYFNGEYVAYAASPRTI